MYFINEEELERTKQDEILSPASSETVPFFGRRHDEMGRGQISKGFAGISVACHESHFNPEIHAIQARGPIVKTLFAQGFVGSHVDNLALLADAFGLGRRRAVNVEVGGEESAHCHLKDGRFARSSRS